MSPVVILVAVELIFVTVIARHATGRDRALWLSVVYGTVATICACICLIWMASSQPPPFSLTPLLILGLVNLPLALRAHHVLTSVKV